MRLGLSGERERKAALCGGTQQSFPQGRVLFPYLPARIWSLYAPVILCSVFFFWKSYWMVISTGTKRGMKEKSELCVCIYIYKVLVSKNTEFFFCEISVVRKVHSKSIISV